MTPKREGPNFTADDFQDVSVVAYKHPKENLGRIPAEGEVVMIPGYEIVIIESDQRRVRKVKIRRIAVDEPTLQMTFAVNTSPFAGRGDISSNITASCAGCG